jgi:hypothetical protein
LPAGSGSFEPDQGMRTMTSGTATFPARIVVPVSDGRRFGYATIRGADFVAVLEVRIPCRVMVCGLPLPNVGRFSCR